MEQFPLPIFFPYVTSSFSSSHYHDLALSPQDLITQLAPTKNSLSLSLSSHHYYLCCLSLCTSHQSNPSLLSRQNLSSKISHLISSLRLIFPLYVPFSFSILLFFFIQLSSMASSISHRRKEQSSSTFDAYSEGCSVSSSFREQEQVPK